MGAEAWLDVERRTLAADLRFRSQLKDLESVQRRLLEGLLARNSSTVFGREHAFSRIRSAEAFRDRVPVRGYDAFSPYIERVLLGEEAVLTAEPILFAEQTGGSSGGSKIIPYTGTGLTAFRDCLYPWLSDLMRKRPGITRGRSYFSLSPVGRSLDARIGALRLGSPAPFAYFGDLRESLISLSSVPMELRLLTDFDTWQLKTCLHLLVDDSLALVWVWSPTYFTELLHAMHREAATLLPLAEAMLAAARAPEVVSNRMRTLERGLLGRHADFSALWPRLDTISCWTDASSKGFADELRGLLQGVFVQSKGLMSTEAAVSIPYGEGEGSVLAPEGGFFEFADETGTCHFGWQLEAGRRYRVLVTTGSGLYRYDTRDMVLVVGHADGTPRLRFVGRAGAATDLCGEKLTDEFVLESLERSGISSVSYALLAAMPTPRPHYRLYVESRSLSSDPSLGERLDGALSSNPQYEYARRMGQLSGVVTCHVKDLYGRVKRHRLRSGTSVAGMKAPVLIGQADAGLIAALDEDPA